MRGRWVALSICVALAAVACGGEGRNGGAPVSVTGAGDDLFADDFEPVCRGIAVPGATPYDPGAPGMHPLLVFSGAAPDFTQDVTTLPDGWGAQHPDLEDTEIVACVDRVAATLADTCTGYDVELEGDYSVETHDAVYDVVLYAATSAAEIARLTLDVPAAGCPSVVLFTEGEHVRAWYEPFGDRLEAFLAPHVGG